MAQPQQVQDDVEVGIIGMGDMGRLYANKLLSAGWTVNVCDIPERYQALKDEFKGTALNVFKDGHYVSRRSDFIIYSVEARYIEGVVERYGPCESFGREGVLV